MSDDIIRADSSQTPEEAPCVRQNILNSHFHMVAINKHARLAEVFILKAAHSINKVCSAYADTGFIHCSIYHCSGRLC